MIYERNPMVNVLVREARDQDYSDLCTLMGQVDELHQDNLPHRFQRHDGPARDRDYILGLIADENVGLFVAEVDGELVGFVHVVLRDSPPLAIFVPRRYAIVDTLVVDQDSRRKGVGQALMNKAHHWARERGATTIELNVYEFNQDAIAFYQALGYAVIRHQMGRPLA